jgi:adenine specific DNA methylase mod
MAAINDLIAQVDNPELRARLEQEVARLNKQKKFGLVFEEHMPECTPLYEMPIRVGGHVALRTQKDIQKVYTVLAIAEDKALCICESDKEQGEFALSDLVAVAQFGEPIYPYLKPLDSVCNAPDSDLWHTLIEADNYHALQLLEYLYAGQVDCIYIDPPYNTGAKDWKYNNDYVDGNDSYRHSKWLSMMQKRLKLAKKLLNPHDSVLIVTIDEKEYLHLGCLLEEMFPEARIQMVSSMINPANVAREGEFGRSGEYLFFVMIGSSSPQRVRLDREWVSGKGRTHTGQVRWDLLKRSGTNSERKHSPGGFYPIYINSESGKIEKIGEPLPAGISDAPEVAGCYTLLPIRQNGSEGNWQWSPTTFRDRMAQGRVRIGGNKDRGFTVYILKDGEYTKITSGEFEIIGHGINGEIIVADNDTDAVMATPGDIWRISSHDATQYGSRLIGNIFGDRRFTFPKSLYAVKDCLYFFTANKQNAVIMDFFAGSGTTLHAVNLLNAEDGGHRRCIMVTNNEVSAEEEKSLTEQGYHPGDEAWDKLGIARYVTWPRTVCSIEGHDVNGNPLKGNYIGSELPMADGFKANAAFFKLGFLDKTSVALGRQFAELLPVLWMKAGAIGPCPSIATDEAPQMMFFPENRLAVLQDEASFPAFEKQLGQFPTIKAIYIVTDYEAGFRAMSDRLAGCKCYQLYRDYLDNFRINQGRA